MILCTLALYLFAGGELSAQYCECKEYIYLNEPTTNGAIHKYEVNADGSLTEIGNPWFDNAVANEGVVSPHGLGVDINGFLYIGESFNDGFEVRKFSCDGEIFPESEFAVTTTGQYNISSIGNNIYLNARGNNVADIQAFDICDGDLVHSVSFCETADFDAAADWGFYIDPNTGIFYATVGFFGSDNYFWTFTLDDFDNDPNTCVAATDLGPEFPANADVRGVTTDNDGNIYIAVQEDFSLPGDPAYIIKFGPAPDYTFLGRSSFDTSEDGTGFRRLIGLIYSESSDRIYASTESAVDDCVSIFSTDLDYLGVAVPSPGTGDSGKGIAILKECCPTGDDQVVSMVVCTNGTRDSIFINDIFPCESILCEAQWVGADAASNGILTTCDLTINTDAAPGCYSFVRSSDGSGAKQCGAFTQTLNVEIIELPDVTLLGDQTIDCGDMAADLTANTAGTVIRWESNAVTCQAMNSWTPIPGTDGLTTYNPGRLNQTTHYRAVISGSSAGNGADCLGGTCELASECITVTVAGPCTFDLALQKQLSSPATIYRPGSPVSFVITIINQGGTDAFDIDVSDYFNPSELTFLGFSNTPTSGFSSGSPNAWDFTIDELAFNSSITIRIDFMINENFTGTQIINNAEIVDAAETPGGPTATDEDSFLTDRNDGTTNELDSDNDISDDSNGGLDNPNDQDDYDPAVVQVCVSNCSNFPWQGN